MSSGGSKGEQEEQPKPAAAVAQATGGGGGGVDRRRSSMGARRGARADEAAADEVSNSSSGDFRSDDDDYAWIPWFCSLKGNEFFCEVDESYVRDGFNLTGLNTMVSNYEAALDLLLDMETNDEHLSEEQQESIENDAEHLYGLIHARFVLTSRGLQLMHEKYRQAQFGRCPRVLCRGQPALPIGLSDVPNEENAKLYCPRCEDVYHSRSGRHEHIDGAYFGTTFPHLFFLSYPELKPPKSSETYVPRCFGFRVNQDAYKKSLDYKKKLGKQGSGSQLDF